MVGYHPPVASRRVGPSERFELLAPLGSGGAATVWRSLDRTTGTNVALKVLHEHLRFDSVVCARFRREVEIGQALDHKAFARVGELVETPSFLGFPLELLEGQTLKERIHERGVVHRDFKPQNVFLCANGDVRLLDFGFAHTNAAAGLTTKSVVLCTPDYAPPEIVGGAAVDCRADLYSLGATLFEAASGQVPFRGATSFDLLRQHLTAPAPRLRSLAPAAPERLDALVARLLEKRPEDRFPTAQAVLAQLDAGAASSAQQPAESCHSCGEPRAPTWPVCPSCGLAADGAAAKGDGLEQALAALEGPCGQLNAGDPAPQASPGQARGRSFMILKGSAPWFGCANPSRQPECGELRALGAPYSVATATGLGVTCLVYERGGRIVAVAAECQRRRTAASHLSH